MQHRQSEMKNVQQKRSPENSEAAFPWQQSYLHSMQTPPPPLPSTIPFLVFPGPDQTPGPTLIHTNSTGANVCRQASNERAVRGAGRHRPGSADAGAEAAERAVGRGAGRVGHARFLLLPALPFCLRRQGPGPHLHGPRL